MRSGFDCQSGTRARYFVMASSRLSPSGSGNSTISEIMATSLPGNSQPTTGREFQRRSDAPPMPLAWPEQIGHTRSKRGETDSRAGMAEPQGRAELQGRLQDRPFLLPLRARLCRPLPVEPALRPPDENVLPPVRVRVGVVGGREIQGVGPVRVAPLAFRRDVI